MKGAHSDFEGAQIDLGAHGAPDFDLCALNFFLKQHTILIHFSTRISGFFVRKGTGYFSDLRGQCVLKCTFKDTVSH